MAVLLTLMNTGCKVSPKKTDAQKSPFYTISTEIEKGVSLMKDLSDDGLDIVTKEFIWVAGYGRASTRQAAVDYAQTDALNNASVLITEILKKERQSLDRAYHSENILKGFQPVGDVEIQYKDGMYEARAKVGMPRDLFVKYLESHSKKNSD